jgi:hypothetical protein
MNSGTEPNLPDERPRIDVTTHAEGVVPAADSEEFRDHRLVDEQGEELGKVTDVIYDAATNRPTWLVVHTGVLHGDHYLPVEGSYRAEDGAIITPFDKHTLHHAAKAPKDHVLTAELERELCDQYGVAAREGGSE